MGVMRVFQLPLVAKYCCVAKAQPATPGSTDTDEKSPNLHGLSLLHPVTTPPVASTVPGPAICTSGLRASPSANTFVVAVPAGVSVNAQLRNTFSPLGANPTAIEGLKSSLLPLWNAKVVSTVFLLGSSNLQP
jgi:hypothetical protein